MRNYNSQFSSLTKVRIGFRETVKLLESCEVERLQPIKGLRVVTEDLINRRSGDLPVRFEFPQRVDL
jgi:predicted ThiF/HesA family dinucleotide-utilizing enzyme